MPLWSWHACTENWHESLHAPSWSQLGSPSMHSSRLGFFGAAVPSTFSTLMQSAFFEDPPGSTVAEPMVGIDEMAASAAAMESNPHQERVRR
jgi:hypothetical protein